MMQMMIMTCFVISIGAMLYSIFIQLFEFFTKKPLSAFTLFHNFKQKIWMTLGLGITFFSLYYTIIKISSHSLDQKQKLELFYKVQETPITYAYLGLFIFVTLSLMIYLVRLVIKYLYHLKKR